MLDTDSTIQFYADLSGNPLQGGQVFFGVAGQNPVTSPLTVYWDADGTQPAFQPIAVKNGQTTRNGAPARVYIPSGYSKLLQDSKGRQVSFDASLPAPLRSDLAAPGGAGLVGFLLVRTDAQKRDLPDKLGDWVSVKDFGVKGDGLTNDTARWDKARDRALTDGLSLFMPKGGYLIDEFQLASGVSWLGAGVASTVLIARPGNVNPFITMPAGQVRDFNMGGFTLQGDLTNAGQKAMYLQAQLSGADGGLWYADFERIKVRNFSGDCIHVEGGFTTVDRPNQFVHWRSIDVRRPAGSANHGLKLEGQNEHMTFTNSQFDGTQGGKTGTGVRLTRGNIGSGADIRPNAIKFINCSTQWANLGMYIDRAENVSVDTHWFESLNNGVDIEASALAVDIYNSRFANAADNGGAGIAVKVGGNVIGSLRYCRFLGVNDIQVSCNGHAGFDIIDCPDITVTVGDVPTIAYAAGAEIITSAHRTVIVSATAAGLTCNTITSKRGVGEQLVMRVNTNAVTFTTGANLYLGPGVASKVIPAGSVVAWMRQDATSSSWYLMSVT